jgi:hypothetical protein
VRTRRRRQRCWQSTPAEPPTPLAKRTRQRRDTASPATPANVDVANAATPPTRPPPAPLEKAHPPTSQSLPRRQQIGVALERVTYCNPIAFHHHRLPICTLFTIAAYPFARFSPSRRSRCDLPSPPPSPCPSLYGSNPQRHQRKKPNFRGNRYLCH